MRAGTQCVVEYDHRVGSSSDDGNSLHDRAFPVTHPTETNRHGDELSPRLEAPSDAS